MKKVKLTTATLAILAGAMSAPLMTNAESASTEPVVRSVSEESGLEEAKETAKGDIDSLVASGNLTKVQGDSYKRLIDAAVTS